jgi:hypothetical protein
MKKRLHSILFAGLMSVVATCVSNCQRPEILEISDHIVYLKYYKIADEPVAMVEANDGYTILANGVNHQSIGFLQLLHVDAMGNILWQRTVQEDSASWTGNDLIVTADGGYAVAGEWYEPSEQHVAQLIRFSNQGDTLWTANFPLDDIVEHPFSDFPALARIRRNSVGKGVAELPDGRLALFSTESGQDIGEHWFLQFVSPQGEADTSVRHGEGYNYSAASITNIEEDLLVVGQYHFGHDVDETDIVVMRINKDNDFDFEAAIHDHLHHEYQGSTLHGGNQDIAQRIAIGPDGIFIVGTTISNFDAMPHLYVIKANYLLETQWEFVDDQEDSPDRGYGLSIVALPNGGAVAVGKSYVNGVWDLYAIELAADTQGVNQMVRTQRSFTYGSEDIEESAHAIIVTEDNHWLILGKSSYEGQTGLWLMKIDPTDLPPF